MRRSSLLVVFLFALATAGVATGRQLAMLVEVTPQQAVAGGTLTEIVVRIAPEDRAALGKDVMLWVELSREEVRVLRRGWALKIDDPAEPLEAEIVIPDGPHVLRVDLKGAGDRSTGVWWGDVDVSVPAPAPAPAPVPDDSEQRQQAAAATAAATSPAPAPAPAPGPESVPGSSDSDSEQRQQPVAATAAAAGAAAGAATSPAPAPDPESSSGSSDSDSEQRQQPVAATAAAAGAATSPAPAPAPGPESVLGHSDSDSEQRQQPAAGSAAAAAAAAATAADAASASVSASPPVVTEPARRSGAGELTVAVTRNHRPVVGLVATQFKIEVDRDAVSTAFVADPNRVPLNLALAHDLHEESSADLAWVGEMVRRLVEQARRRPRDVFVTGIDGGFRRTGSGDTAPMIAPAGPESENDFPAMVRSSLESLRSTTGATVLLVITDGSGPRSGKAWSDAHRAASEAGVPVLVAGIWNEGFGSGLRRDLRKLASASGGAVFYVQGPGQADNLVERFGAILEACTTVAVDAPPGTPGVEVSLIGVDADVYASTAVRWGAGLADPQTDETRRGRFTYMADAALFEDCGSGLRFPVAMEADYLAAERAYLETRTEPGSAVLMTIDGRLESRPPMEGDGLIEMIVIDRFIAVHPGGECE